MPSAALAPDDAAGVPGQAPAHRGWSLRGRLLALVLGVTLFAWLVGGVVTVRAVDDIDARMRDQRLLQLSATVLAFARHELAEAGFAPGPQTVEDRPSGLDLRYRYQVWHRGRLLLHSPDAPADRPLAGSQVPGFFDTRLDGRPLRSLVVAPDAAGLQVQVGELLDPDSPGLPLPGRDVLLLMLASVLTVGLLAAALLVRALKPVAEAEQRLRQRAPHELQPLPLDGLPDEVRPLMTTLNDHLGRAADRLSRETGFTALAAHELRTPLAALRMQVQVAMRAPDADTRQAQLSAVLRSVDRHAHLIDQLLTLARVEQGPAGARQPVALRALCVEVAAELDAEQRRRGSTIAVTGPELSVSGWDFALEVLLRNLLGNALAHAPSAAAIAVQLSAAADGAVVLCVDDAGPGIPAADRDRVFQRFVRLDRSVRTPGSGLGLSIVRAVADVHGAAVQLLQSPLGGLRVRVVFPAAAGPGGSPGPAP